MTRKLTEWNRRYLAYACAHGMSPEAMLESDREKWPGGCMAGYLLWINEAWEEFARQQGFRRRDEVFLGLDDPHRKFDAWLRLRAEAQQQQLQRNEWEEHRQKEEQGQRG